MWRLNASRTRSLDRGPEIPLCYYFLGSHAGHRMLHVPAPGPGIHHRSHRHLRHKQGQIHYPGHSGTLPYVPNHTMLS
jgi:hypothetical protein